MVRTSTTTNNKPRLKGHATARVCGVCGWWPWSDVCRCGATKLNNFRLDEVTENSKPEICSFRLHKNGLQPMSRRDIHHYHKKLCQNRNDLEVLWAILYYLCEFTEYFVEDVPEANRKLATRWVV